MKLMPATLRARLMFLAFLAVLPALVLVIYNTYEQRRMGLSSAASDTLQLVRLIRAEHDRNVGDARLILSSIAELPQLRQVQPAAAEALLKRLFEIYTTFHNLSAATPDGRIFATSRIETNRLAYGDLPFWHEVTNRQTFVLGNYYVIPGTTQAVAHAAHPVLDDRGALAAVAVATFDLNWLYRRHREAELPANSSFTVLGSDRVTLARFPQTEELVGAIIESSPSSDTRHERPRSYYDAERSRVLTGRDGVRRLYGSLGLSELTASPVTVSVGIPTEFAYASANLVLSRNLVLLALASTLAFMAAWVGGSRFILNKVRALVQAAREMEQGDLSVRTRAKATRNELDRLSLAFNHMAASLERQFAERVRAEEALKALNRDLEAVIEERTGELKRSNEDLEQFAYVASHDLREPLRMVTSYLDLLKKRHGEKLDGDAGEFVDFASEGARRMHRLIDDLLTYSRVESRQRPFENVDLNEVMEQARENLGLAIKESGATIQCPALPTVRGDFTQLTQLFQNLVSNGIKFRGEKPPRIDITVRREDGEWIISFLDNGIGIDGKHFERIFIIFQRLHNREKYSGTGIGLSLCKKIAERHGGRIWVESEKNKGSTFHVAIAASDTDHAPPA